LEIGGNLAIVDPATRPVKQTVKFEIPGLRSEAIQPVSINITKDGKLGFVALGPANRVAVLDGIARVKLTYLLAGQRVWHGVRRAQCRGQDRAVFAIEERSLKDCAR